MAETFFAWKPENRPPQSYEHAPQQKARRNGGLSDRSEARRVLSKPHGWFCTSIPGTLASATGDQQAELTQIAIIGTFVAEHIGTALLHARHLAVRHVGNDALQLGIVRIAGV